MSTKEAYNQKIIAVLEAEILKFGEFRELEKRLPAEERTKHAERVEVIEQKIRVARSKLKELEAVDEGTWEQLVEGIEHTWTALQDTLQDAITTFAKKH